MADRHSGKERGKERGKDGLGIGVAALVPIIFCGAGYLLIAAGVLAGAGALLRSSWPLLLAGTALIAAVAIAVWRNRRRRHREDDTDIARSTRDDDHWARDREAAP